MMTLDELKTWAAINGLTVVDRAEWNQLCSEYAHCVALEADLDRDFKALFGRPRG